MQLWRAKLKHFLILSSAGKPIYSRHGDDQLITNYIGVVQTIISFYQSTNDTLRGFTAGDVRFVVMSRGPLNLVAITRLSESDSQLRSQLEALYMQILSTLTLPSMQRMFAARANYDLRRPLQGTETLLSALADGFTRGSPSTLLSALECLKLRKSHRTTINNTLLKTRSDHLLYGLLVASGKLVSVVRPKKHSLHPGDLHLIFNMLFEAGSVKAGGGENWIPLCLPGFNNTGYLYMYVSFLNLEHPTEQMQERPRTSDGADEEVAVLLISAEKESFFELRRMRDDLVDVSYFPCSFLYFLRLRNLLIPGCGWSRSQFIRAVGLKRRIRVGNSRTRIAVTFGPASGSTDSYMLTGGHVEWISASDLWMSDNASLGSRYFVSIRYFPFGPCNFIRSDYAC
jgi:hypothetical protein